MTAFFHGELVVLPFYYVEKGGEGANSSAHFGRCITLQLLALCVVAKLNR
jgi:hypothetical protein